jgi:hypothetical protein
LGTLFATVYNRFLGKITDDLYIELTPADTLKDLQNLLIDAIPFFEFPRKNLFDYTIATTEVVEAELNEDSFVLGASLEGSKVIIDISHFNVELTSEEINILAILMK